MKLSDIRKNFAFNIIIRIVLIACISVVCTYVLLTRSMLFAPLVMVILVTVISIDLVQYIRKTTKYLSYVLSAIRDSAYSDTATFQGLSHKGSGFGNILQEVSQEFAKVTVEKELHFQFLQTIIENINVGILIMEPDQRIRLANSHVKKMLALPSLQSAPDLLKVDKKLFDALTTMTAGARQLLKVHAAEQLLQLSIHVKEVVQRQINLRIFILQNISSELEAKEIEAWQKLTQVLTHEIMNSVTPISSLTDAIQSMITENGKPKDLATLDNDSVDDLHNSVVTISSRSKSLMKFVGAYKEFSRVPELRSESFDVVRLVNKVADLFSPDIAQKHIDLNVNATRESIETKGDPVLLEQVLINLLKNAIEAVSQETGMIGIHIKKNITTQVSVSDNGPGIPSDVLEKIFVPFFTTKQKGSGVGLSLSRQILKLHQGNIKVQSLPGEGSVFTIEW
jgi:two-component system, NtrC family, nitrogen regulation sensor histidine kinase NtrY